MTMYLKQHKAGEKVFSICSAASNDYLRAQGIAVETLVSMTEMRILENSVYAGLRYKSDLLQT